MEYTICKLGNTSPGHVTVTLERDDSIVVIKQVPADICANCDEYYLEEKEVQHVYEVAEVAVKNGAELEVRRYAA